MSSDSKSCFDAAVEITIARSSRADTFSPKLAADYLETVFNKLRELKKKEMTPLD